MPKRLPPKRKSQAKQVQSAFCAMEAEAGRLSKTRKSKSDIIRQLCILGQLNGLKPEEAQRFAVNLTGRHNG
ncbi:MAG: hypothetical protein HY544_05725 [Candidatus Diapherotrites archaeon]|uniref:Uncharacterized protein n=1 Tax=Candidatus Iainarchaeum sp. TaxID=3101447 RepID=A0A8T3YMM0_9ARCH|nr:hypothetical protein [Candidatus Diapherotrites archaeon]